MFEIRRVEDRDTEALRGVLAAATRYRRDHTSHKTTELWLASLLEEREIDSQRDVYLGWAGDKAVAAVELVEEAGSLTIAQLIVAEPFRFLGYGRRVAQWVMALGHDLITLGVNATNKGAIAFWENLGFERRGRLGQGAASLILMERLALDGNQVDLADSSL